MNIYVSNLSINTTNESLQKLFTLYGAVVSAIVITDRETGKSRGFGFVEMSDQAAGQKAIDELNQSEFEGKAINVTIARPRAERSENDSFSRGGYNRRSY